MYTAQPDDTRNFDELLENLLFEPFRKFLLMAAFGKMTYLKD